jgi:hypothetical protein
VLPGIIPGLSFLPFDLTRSNPIDQVVNTPSGAIINVARPGHIFYPGTVLTTVSPSSSGSVVETIGTGTGEYSSLNMIVGMLFFGGRNQLLAMGCEATKGNPAAQALFMAKQEGIVEADANGWRYRTRAKEIPD